MTEEAADDDTSGGDLADEFDEMPSPGDWADLARRVLEATVYSGINPAKYKPVEIGRFEAIARIGEGGFGTVFKARDPDLDRIVALKLCRTRSRQVATAIMTEARALAQLDHPNIVAVYETGQHEGGVFFAMQYVQGEDVASFGDPAREPRPTVAQILDVYCQIGRGLAAAHRAGFVHGDIKPSNMLLDGNNFARLADFGLAQKVIRGAPESMRDALRHRSGTLQYMAPEVLRGGPSSKAADQWSLCVSILDTLDGWPPFRGKTTAALLEDIERKLVTVVEGIEHPGLRESLRRGLSLDPRERFPDIDTLVAALDRLREPVPVFSPALDEAELVPRGGEPALSKAKRRALLGSLVLVLAIGLVIGWLGRARIEGPSPVSSVGELGMSAPKHRGWTGGLASYSQALQAVDRGDVRAGYDAWVSARVDMRHSSPRLDGELSLLLAKRVDERNPWIVVAAWMADAAAESFEQAQSWTRAAEARRVAAERARTANDEAEAAEQGRCALVNAMGRPC